MSGLEARVTEAVSTHLEHHGDEYDLRLSASIRKLGGEVAAMLAPMTREAQAEAWQEGHQAGWEEHENPGPFVNDYWDSKLPNPYKEES